jgi:hypothetical protein
MGYPRSPHASRKPVVCPQTNLTAQSEPGQLRFA